MSDMIYWKIFHAETQRSQRREEEFFTTRPELQPKVVDEYIIYGVALIKSFQDEKMREGFSLNSAPHTNHTNGFCPRTRRALRDYEVMIKVCGCLV